LLAKRPYADSRPLNALSALTPKLITEPRWSAGWRGFLLGYFNPLSRRNDCTILGI
jgi:hypothetical protein